MHIEKLAQRESQTVLSNCGNDTPAVFFRTKVAGYKVPREYFSVESVLRHPSGKPDYRWAKSVATGEQQA